MRFSLLAAALLVFVPVVRAQQQVHLTLDQNCIIKLTALTTSNANNIIDGLNANATPGKQFDPRLIPSSGGSTGSGTSDGTAHLYPVFNIPMHDEFVNVELKASVTNFSGSSETNKKVYYANTFAPQDTECDPDVYVFYCVPGPRAAGAPDSRRWYKQFLTSNLALQLAYTPRLAGVQIQPGKVAGSKAWMYRDNASLVWVFTLMDASGNPQIDSNGNPIWTPISPAEWRAVRTVLP